MKTCMETLPKPPSWLWASGVSLYLLIPGSATVDSDRSLSDITCILSLEIAH